MGNVIKGPFALELGINGLKWSESKHKNRSTQDALSNAPKMTPKIKTHATKPRKPKLSKRSFNYLVKVNSPLIYLTKLIHIQNNQLDS